jgi:hypothetical protein
MDQASARNWFFRPVILFSATYLIIGIIHEAAHAMTAYALDVPFTMFHFAVDVAHERGSLTEHAAIGVAGPLCALIIGLVCWLFYSRSKSSRSELMLLYLATFGVATFFGNLMSAAFVGDFSRAAIALRLPASARYAASIVGLLSVCGVHFLAGWKLRTLSPVGSSRLRAMLAMVLIPAVAGAAIMALSFLPMPSALLFPRLAEALFWVFGAAGVLTNRNTPTGDGRTLKVSWADTAVLAAAIIVVRIMAVGIVFEG